MQKLASVALASELDNLSRFTSCASEAARGHGLPPERVGQVELAVEETVLNICQHGGTPGPVPIEMTCLSDGDSFLVELADRGVPFDLTAQPAPDLGLDLAQRPIGGLGTHLVREIADALTYRREGGRNILLMTFGRSPR